MLKGNKQIISPKKLKKPTYKKAGLAPGTLIYTGHKKDMPVKMYVTYYNENTYEKKEFSRVEDIITPENKQTNIWVDIDGIHDIELVEKIGKHFNIHNLVLEDITNNVQRTKIEEYETQLYIVLRMFQYGINISEIENEQLSLILFENILITFQEKNGDVFDNIRERLKTQGTKLRIEGTDYLAYSIIDAIVDSYFQILEKLGEDIENIEDRLLINPEKNDLQKIHLLRRELIFLRKSVWPLRDILNQIIRDDKVFFKKSTTIYLRDVYDHSIQVIDAVESYRDMIMGLLDVYLSSMSNKMNQVMKVLTIISTIFIPLTFLAGVYGMNFKSFPELETKWMYPWGFWVFTIILIVLMLGIFKKKKWL